MSIQKTIIKGIKEQLFFNDYLVLPGFGGFVLKSSSAHFAGAGTLLVAPSKTVTFNVQLKQNDGILALWLQDKLKCGAQESISHLKDFAEYCNSILTAKRRLSLDGIGFFYLDFENNICFEPQHDTNFLSSSFGLAPVSITPHAEEIKEVKKPKTFVDRPAAMLTEIQEEKKFTRNYRRLVAPALLSTVLITFLLLLVSGRKFTGELRSSFFNERTSGTYRYITYPELAIVSVPKMDESFVADANGIAMIDLGTIKIPVKAIYGSGGRSSGKTELAQYEVVLGCFSVLNNAHKLVKQVARKNLKAHVSGKNAKGLYVVSNGQFSTKNEALLHLSTIKDLYPNAWVKQP